MHPVIKILQAPKQQPWTIHIGDCIRSMRRMPEKSVQCCVTSPPYFGLRNYNGGDAEIGKEKTPAEFVASLVAVFREVRRVLKDDGTVWLNLGDSYARTGGTDRKPSATATVGNTKRTMEQIDDRTQTAPPGLKNKDLIGIPWRVAFALQDDGWILRQDIIWHKPNPMPESVRDRCTKAHEYIFLLVKKPKYYFNSSSMQEDGVTPAGTKGAKGSAERAATPGVNSRPPEYKIYDGKRNKRSVWTVTTKPYKGAHFATFPPDLIEPCILAGSRPGGMVLDPFGGSGTTAQVALQHGRRVTLCELNPDYAKLAVERISKISR